MGFEYIVEDLDGLELPLGSMLVIHGAEYSSGDLLFGGICIRFLSTLGFGIRRWGSGDLDIHVCTGLSRLIDRYIIHTYNLVTQSNHYDSNHDDSNHLLLYSTPIAAHSRGPGGAV